MIKIETLLEPCLMYPRRSSDAMVPPSGIDMPVGCGTSPVSVPALALDWSLPNVLMARSIEVLADSLGAEAIELALLNIPRGVLEGRFATSLVTVPRAGL